jgi:HK97 family phage prohead protease
MSREIERRFLAQDLSIETPADGGMPTLRGYAAVFNQRSQELWGFYEIIAPGAFTASIAAQDDVRALWNHDPNWIMARTANGTLRLHEDDHGLAVEFEPVDTPIMRGFVASIERRDVTQMSFAFQAEDARWDVDDNEQWARTVLRAKLYDVSPVTYPAYTETEIALRRAGTTDAALGYIPARPNAPQPDHSAGATPADWTLAISIRQRRHQP